MTLRSSLVLLKHVFVSHNLIQFVPSSETASSISAVSAYAESTSAASKGKKVCVPQKSKSFYLNNDFVGSKIFFVSVVQV